VPSAVALTAGDVLCEQSIDLTEDLVALRELLLHEIGRPRWTTIYGQSMAATIVVASLELRRTSTRGGLAECGLVDGPSPDTCSRTPPPPS